MHNRVSIIGTAGRREDAHRIDRTLYDAMYAEAAAALSRWQAVEAVSGGAAVADHLAVRAFLQGDVADLTLYLPAEFGNGAFVPNPAVRFNPGATSNRYHKAFSEACGIDSLSEIADAIAAGARVEVHEGFHRRNSEVAANCTHMLAFTFGAGSSGGISPAVGASETGLKDGGPAFHGKAIEGETRRMPYRDFMPSDPGFTDATAAGLRDGGTAHCWSQAWKPKIKRHVHLGELLRGCRS